MPRAGSSISLQASNDFHGNSALRSTSAAWGATFSSQKARRVSRNSRWTSVRAKVGGAHHAILAGPARAASPGAAVGRARQVARPGGGAAVGELHRRHLGDPVRHVLEDLEGVGAAHARGGALGGRPADRPVAGRPDVERRDRAPAPGPGARRRPWPGTSSRAAVRAPGSVERRHVHLGVLVVEPGLGQHRGQAAAGAVGAEQQPLGDLGRAEGLRRRRREAAWAGSPPSSACCRASGCGVETTLSERTRAGWRDATIQASMPPQS